MRVARPQRKVKFASPRHTERRLRRPTGDFLIEALIASLIAAYLMSGLGEMYTIIHKAGNEAQAQLSSAAVCQEIIDNCRAQAFSTLIANLGYHYPQVNGAGLGTTGDALFPRPLMKDSSLDYSGNGDPTVSEVQSNIWLTTVNPTSGAYSNTITVYLSQNSGQTGASYPVYITVTCAYLDSSGGYRKYTANSVVSPDGLNG